MKKYLIALDLDGTLLTDKENITKETISYLEELQNNGHKIVLATGRPFRAAVGYYNELKLNTPLICDNGNSIYQMNDKDFKTQLACINKKDSDSIFKFSKNHLKMAFYNVDNHFYSYKAENYNFPFFHIEENTVIVKGDLDSSNHKEPIILMYALKVSFQNEFESHMKNYPDLSIRNWGIWDEVILYEIHNKNENKGKAILKVASHLKMTKDNIITFGDGSNDFELLTTGFLNVCMINGNKELKNKIKTHSLKTNNENGVIDYLKQFFNKNA